MFISSKRKVKYKVSIQILSLSNLPYVAGRFFCKWKLKSTTLKGATQRASVLDSKVLFENSVFDFDVTLIIGKDGTLLSKEFTIIVKMETKGGSSSERIGVVTFCLSNMAGGGQPKTQRYLLQESKSNSILKVAVEMRLLSGDPALFKMYLKSN